MHASLAKARSEDGAYLIISAFVMVAVLTMAAIVLDLSALRQDRTSNRATADAASTAGALTLAALDGTAAQGCQDAWAFFLANTPDAKPVIAAPNCETAFEAECSPTVGREPAVGRAGDYVVSIYHPVLDDSDLMIRPDSIGSPTQAANVDNDGDPCERMGVTIERERKSYFAGVIGVDSSSTTSRSVARATDRGGEGDAVALLLLERESCNALTASGNASVVVKSHPGIPGDPDATPPIAPIGPRPGQIALDSSGTGGTGNNSCNTGNRKVIEALGNQNSRIIAEGLPDGGPDGVIQMFALAPGQGNDRAYKEDNVTSGRLSPRPTAGDTRIGRAPVDHRYDCKEDNDCPEADGLANAHITNLRAAYGGTGQPPGFDVYPRLDTVLFPDDSCSTQPSTPAIVLPPGDWWVNCPGGFSINNTVVFQGGDVVFEGGVSVSGSLVINAAGAPDNLDDEDNNQIAFFRNGDFTKGAQGAVQIYRTVVYIVSGRISFGGGSGPAPLTWTAPFAGPFEDLALWSESEEEHALGGQANLDMEGVFFMPEATPFSFTGQGFQQQLSAQFITRRMEVKGQGALEMTPDPTRIVLIPLRGVALIR